MTDSSDLSRLEKDFDVVAFEVWQELQTLIPAELQIYLKDVQFTVCDHPGPELAEDLPEEAVDDPLSLCGLYVGVPLTEASLVSPSLEPSRIYLFRHALLDLVGEVEDNPRQALKVEIAVTLLHEIGHFFGLDEDDLERLGYD